MNKKIIISDDELAEHGGIKNLSKKAESLLLHQKKNWRMVRENFKLFDSVKTKAYDFDNIYIKTQYNPSRMKSSTAEVDKKSIENRACFLCQENLPSPQRGINYKDKYIILCNPYPIFKQHLTIPHYRHIPQSIKSNFTDLLEITYDLRDNFVLFYNGPNCGASAPDHLHFQAGLKNSTPLEEYDKLLVKNGISIYANEQVNVDLVNEKIFNYLNVKSKNMHQMELVFEMIYNQLKKLNYSFEEPMLNIVSSYENGHWNLFIFPRKKHRPEQFFQIGKSKILVSPASADMAGLLIIPREEDFEKLTKAEIEDIYGQVVFGDELLQTFENYN